MSELRAAMSALTHSVYVLGVHTPEKDNLMTCAWLSQVSGTGASQGIGLAVAQLFVRYGAQMAMIDHSGRPFKEAERLGAQAIAVRCDVADELQVKRTVATVLNQFEKIDILVNNAGSIVRKNVVDTTAEEWDSTMNVGVRGTFLFSKYVIPHMASQGGRAC